MELANGMIKVPYMDAYAEIYDVDKNDDEDYFAFVEFYEKVPGNLVLLINNEKCYEKAIYKIVTGTKYSTNSEMIRLSDLTKTLNYGNYTAKIQIVDGDEIIELAESKFEVKNGNTPNVKVEVTQNVIEGSDVEVIITAPASKDYATIFVDGVKKGSISLINGKDTFNIGTLSVGQHQVKVSYLSEEETENGINEVKFTGNFTVTVTAKAKETTQPTTPATVKKVTKIASKITAAKKTFKAKTKTKKYTIKLTAGKKAIKKAQVSLKIGKKTFKARTNANGKATFKITKLTKKGKYYAIIKYSGNSAYNAVTKKVKITITK